jgi:hypothetical protein
MSDDTSYFKSLVEQYPEFVKNRHSWAALVERYRDAVDNLGSSPQMLHLVEYLTAQEYASFFYPGTSHMRLCISTELYPQRAVDSLVIWFDDFVHLYQINYYEFGSMKPEKRMCSESQVHSIVELKLLRMKVVADEAPPNKSFERTAR